MFYKIDEYVYLENNKYIFKEIKIIDKSRIVYCLVAVSGDTVHGLLQSFERPSLDEKDKAINKYLKNKERLINFEYAKAKDLIKITHYKVGQ